jgi:CDP-6-deoxy-D-xylo-4-hexulose-3-dehydrase
MESGKERDDTLQRLESNGVESRKLFSCLPTQEKAYEFLGHRLGDFPVAESIGKRGLFLPIHQELTEEDMEKICALV